MTRWGGLLLLLAGCSGGGGAAPVLRDSDLAEIRRLQDSYPAAWIANDPEAVMNCFVTDAILVPHHGVEPVEGEAAIRAFFWPPDTPAIGVEEFVLSPHEIDGRGNLAFARGRFRLRLSLDDGAEKRAFANEGNYLMILRRETDGWLISRYIWNDPPPDDL